MDDKTKRDLALWRLGVLGPLVSARLEHGDRQAHFDEIAGRVHQMPDGRVIQLSPRTIESWYYAYKRDGFEALHPSTRSDRGHSRAIAAAMAELILRAKREKPRRSIRRIIRMLERAGKAKPGELSRSSVHRLLRLAGLSARPLRGPSAERRSFIAEHAGDLWVGDALHGRRPVIASDGTLRKWYLLSQLDNATRYLPHSYVALSEGAAAQEYGFKQAILKYGLPHTYYVDRGSAYIALSLRMICAELGIHLLHAGAGDCEAKGVIERWHRTFREEVEDELPAEPIPLADLNAKVWAWLGAEYHVRVHDTTQRAPRDHFLAEVDAIRPVPHRTKLDEVFLHREIRTVRKDGTVRWRGGFLEVRSELRGQVELRYDPHDETALPKVFVDDRFVCDTVPLDRLKNMTRRRRRIAGEPAPDATPSGLDPLSQIEDEHYRRTRLSYDGPDDDTEDDEED